MPVKLSNNADMLNGFTSQLQVTTDARPDLTMVEVLQHGLPGDVITAGLQSLPASVVSLASAVALVAVCAWQTRNLRPAVVRRSTPA